MAGGPDHSGSQGQVAPPYDRRMNLQSDPTPESPWATVPDKGSARLYKVCRHCASYTQIADLLDIKFARDRMKFMKQFVTLGYMFPIGVRQLKFMLSHMDCAEIWLENQSR